MRKVLVAVAFGVLAASPGAALADTVTFSQGALIIPMEATFQQQGGMVSAYGLVYRILQANAPGHLNASNPVTVYIVNNPSKSSPNRCIPSNLSSVNTSSTITNATPGTGTWTDGCDVTITNSTRQPVVPVDYSATYTPGMIWPDAALTTYADPDAFPNYTQSAALTGSSFTSVSYLGAPFVIDAPDVPAVMNLLKNGDTGTDASPKAAIDVFTDSMSSTSGHCDASSISTKTTSSGGLILPGGCHYVTMHQATTSFTANVDRRINQAPKPFMLFEPGNPGSGGAILDHYLEIAGLYVGGTANHADSRGCPLGDMGGCTANGSTCAAGTECPAGSVHHGNIYDLVGDTDNQYQGGSFPNGLINYKVSGKLFYRLYWAPHWDGSSGDTKSVSNVVAFLNNPGTAMMSECASITLWENGDGNSKSSPSNTYGGPGHSSNFIFTNGISVSSTVSGPNCSDPKWPSGTSTCASYPNPGNIFSQVGDWTYVAQGGSNPGYKALSGMQVWAKQMVTTSNGQDAFDMGQKDASHGTVIYVSGHDVSGDPNGARVVLNSMLNLGGDPVASDRDLAAPVVTLGRADSSVSYPDTLVTGTYQAISGYSTNPAVETFDPSNPGLWTFPYFPGNLRAHDLTTLSAGETDYSTDTTWDGAEANSPDGINPSPSQRNLFTYFAGYPKANPTMPGGGSAPNGVLQWNWTPEAVDGSILSSVCTLGSAVTGCVDKMGYVQLVSSPTYDDGESYNGLRLVVGGDGLCDLQQIVNYTDLNSGADWTGGDCNANDVKKFLQDAPNVALMLQRVRGYCFAGALTALQPLDAACQAASLSNITNDNRAQLGGLAHSTPAIVGPSPNISDLGANRPTVAYVGGLDGQLHAFYVGGGAGYEGPASTVSFAYDSDATAKFYKDWGGTSSSPFGTVAQGTELWSFLPASQLPHLFNNSAQVDSSPVVTDVFADFAGTGLREWHTVLVQSIGANGEELFALDVTNPLRPRLLWDISGQLFQTGSSPYYSPLMLLNDSFSVASGGTASCTNSGVTSGIPGSCVSPKWVEGTAKYLPKPATDPGRTDTKVFDYQDLGGASALSIAQVRIGLEPYFVLYAATNMKQGSKGLEVFAIDVATGQKLWQWQHAYTDASRSSSNTVPAAPTVLYGENGASRVLVGDMEGKVWELDALTGQNVRDLAACHGTSVCNKWLFDDGSSNAAAGSDAPISTNIALAKVPTNIAAGNALSHCAGATVLLFGTGGEDWVSSPATTVGKVHLVVYDNAGNAACTLGEPAAFPVTFAAGERVYGNITIAGAVAYVATAKGNVGGDIMAVSAQTGGKTYAIDLGTAKAGALDTALAGSYATFGGLAVYDPSGAGSAPAGVIGSEVSKINVIGNSSLTSLHDSKVDPNLSQAKSSWTYEFRNWLRRFLK